MTETPSAAPSKKPARKARQVGGLNSMLLADLKSMAAGLGIAGAGSMKKAQLVDAIKATQSGRRRRPSRARPPPSSRPEVEQAREQPRRRSRAAPSSRAEQTAGRATDGADPHPQAAPGRAGRRGAGRAARRAAAAKPAAGPVQAADQKPAKQDQQKQNDQKQGQKQPQGKQNQQDQPAAGPQQQDRSSRTAASRSGSSRTAASRPRTSRTSGPQTSRTTTRTTRAAAAATGAVAAATATVRTAGRRNEPDTTILEDDVLVPAAGILDVLDNCAFVRTSGYLPGPEDVYLSLSMVRKYHLRRGDAVVGQVRQPREGERREKFNPMVRIDSVNGTEAEGAKERPDFADAVPVHPHQRLRLATDEANLTGRVIDIAAPVGKGQRGLVLTPPRTGATSLLQSIAQSVTTNNPECHVMVVLVDTRPEEVTDFQRAVKGEVVASTFDRQPADHTLVAELAIERAKRLVELGHDVVVLLDSLTRLGRAYNLAAPANGRVLGGLVDASAVHPTKEFFGAARKLEDAGSLTILATVSVGTGSATDEFFLEELEGTANLELVLSADRAAKGIVPAVDVAASGTRHEDRLLAPAEGAVVGNLRKQLAAADSAAGRDQGLRLAR